jgi:hypothetical protein
VGRDDLNVVRNALEAYLAAEPATPAPAGC